MDLAICHDASFQATVNGTDHDMRMGITLLLLLGLVAGLTSCRGTDSKVSSLVDLDTPSALAGEGEFLDGDDFFEGDTQYFEDDGGDPAAVAYKAGTILTRSTPPTSSTAMIRWCTACWLASAFSTTRQSVFPVGFSHC